MNEIKQFPFYKNYYDLLDNLPKEDKKMMLEVIVDFVFKDKEPTNLKGMNLAIWNNIKMPLATTRKQIINGQKGGRPKKEKNPKQNLNDNPNENPSKNPNNNPKHNQNKFYIYISNLYLIIENNIYFNNKELLVNKLKEWIEYKYQKSSKYTEIGFKKLLKQIENNIELYGEQQVIDLIDECMASNYQGIIFDKLKNNKKIIKQETLPDWFNKELKNEPMTEKEKDEVNDLLEAIENM